MPRSRSSKNPEPEATPRLGRSLLWLAFAGVWLFLTLSLVSFDPADPPGHVVFPPNAPTANWCGPIGAGVAYYLLRLVGVGVGVPMLFGLIALSLTALGRGFGQPVIRVVGVALLTAALSAGAAVVAPAAGPIPNLAGGTVGVAGAAELLPRFSTGGTLVWIAVLTAIGLVVTCDRHLWTLPAAAIRTMIPAARRTREVAGGAAAGAGSAARAGGSLIGGLAGMIRSKAPIRVRLSDLDDEPTEIPRATKPRRRLELRPVAIDAPDDADEEAADDPEEDEATPAPPKARRRRGPPRPLPEPVEDEADEDEDIPGAPQVFDQDQLREKIARLPVRFAAQSRQVATDEDLSDLQNLVELEGYRYPGMDLLEDPEENFTERLEELVREQAEALEASLNQYRIEGEVVDIESGPVITLYHVRLAPGTKVAQLNTISADLARSLKAVNIRIVSNMAGRDTVGIEVPNPNKERVRLKELMSNRESFGSMKLPMFLGKDASGDPLITDLTKMPHMLIAGTTGSGKSVCMNTIIMSFLYTKKPNELKLVLVDPKMVEMSQFRDIPHLMCPVVTEMARATAILEWAVTKMDERYELLAEAGCRDIAGYNEMEWEELRERFDPQTEAEEARIPRKLPYMVFIIDELADLMMTNKEVEGSIIRIAQKARAVGIHLILATQRPQANVVTGLIKSNMPCRVAFKVASGMDSRIVLDQKGGELLLGQGDMLYLSPSSHKLIRAQGTLVDDKEIRRVVRFMKEVATPTFERQLVQLRSGDPDEQRLAESENNSSASLAAAQEDPLFDRAVEIVLETKRGSVSLLQRRLAIGYTRASRLIDLMGIAGIIGEHKGSVAREVLISPEEWEAMKELHERELAGGQESLFSEEDGQPDDAEEPPPFRTGSAHADDEEEEEDGPEPENETDPDDPEEDGPEDSDEYDEDETDDEDLEDEDIEEIEFENDDEEDEDDIEEETDEPEPRSTSSGTAR